MADGEVKRVVRNDRTYYKVPESEKKTVKEQINISFAKADAQKTKVEKYGKDNTCTKYYDSDGKELGDVSVFNCENADGQAKKATRIHTADADYYDWDNNGTLDCEDRDREYTFDPDQMRNAKFQQYSQMRPQDREAVGQFGGRPINKLSESELTQLKSKVTGNGPLQILIDEELHSRMQRPDIQNK